MAEPTPEETEIANEDADKEADADVKEHEKINADKVFGPMVDGDKDKIKELQRWERARTKFFKPGQTQSKQEEETESKQEKKDHENKS